jgi:NAD(P)-dependent dehydrogenase (short-subunit alcohol dehydrogenase family)
MTVTIVTGGASGLGLAITERLTARGEQVVVADLDTCDVTQDDQVEAMVDKAAALGPLRGMVLSAAVETRAPLEECTDDDWRHVLDVNVKGAFLCMKHAVPHMVHNGGGSIVALGSTLGLIAAPQYPAYCASKAALTNLCKQVAIEHAGDGVRVNVVAPSATDTGLFMRLTDLAPDPDAVRRQVAERMPMRRLARTEEVCAAVLFLLSDESSYISGSVLPVDGGLAARRQC